MSSSSLDYLELCRLCLVKDRVQAPIFEEDGDVNQIFLKIHACLPVKVSRDDKLPKKICDDCLYNVNAFYQFWNTTANAEKQLLQWLGEVEGLEDKQGYVTEVLDSNVMKQEHGSDNRLDGSVMQVSGHQNMDINMIENMSIITMPAGSEHQFTTVPIDTGGTVQTVQVSGPSTQTAHDQTGVTHLQEVEVDDDEDNMDDGCDNDDGLPVKEETDEGERSLEQTYVSLPCDEAGPSGLQQQKISEMSEITIQQTADGDPKTGVKPRRLVIDKKLAKANIPIRPMVQIKLEPVNFTSLPIFSTGSVQIATKAKLPSKKVKMWSCAQCNIYFPIPQMLELHNKSTHHQPTINKICQGYYTDTDGMFRCQYCTFSSRIRSSTRSHALRRHGSLIKSQTKERAKTPEEVEVQRTIAIEHDDDETSWVVETLDENLPVLAQLNEKKAKDPLESPAKRKCPFCEFTTEKASTHRSHVKRSHYEDWLKLHEKAPTKKEARTPKEKSKKDVAKQIRNCPHCAFETMKKSTLYSHINRTHRGKHQSKRRARLIGDPSGQRHNNAFAHTGYACSHCTFAGARMSSLRYHTAREHGEHELAIIELPVTEFDCEQCDFKSKSRKIMQHHLKTQHRMLANEEGLYTCHLCSYESTSRMGVQRHISVKHDRQRREARAGMEATVFKCDNCDYQTFNAKILEWHNKQHEADAHAEDDGNAYYCNDCDFSTWTKGQLYTHIKRNHRSDESGVKKEKTEETGADETVGHRFTCDLCDYTSKNKHVMKVHVIRKHTEGYNHACELCGKKYKVKADLTNHMRFQHREQPIICDVCGKTCRNSNLLYLHQKFAHYKPEFECHICHRRMVTQANLDEHILKQHEQRQDAICEECGKTFTRQSRLKIHMRTHLGLRPYTCHICGKAFARKNGLRQHLLIHTGQRPYVCDICGKDFTQKTGLISHRKSHPGSHPPLPRVYIDHVLSTLNQNKP